MDVRRLVVAADDRTGALETAGAIADAGFTVAMVPWVSGPGWAERRDESAPPAAFAQVVVIDLASRHEAPTVAASKAASTHSLPAERSAHKIDSTLRGNWSHELAAVVATGRRVLLVPAFPAAGRTCVDGTVLEGGIPVTERHAARDVRSPVYSSRPADHLRLAGIEAVESLPDASAVRRWLGSQSEASVGVCDATTDDDLRELGASWAQADARVVLAGTAAAIGAAAAFLAGERSIPVSRPTLAQPVLVVAGSAHPIARAQTDSLVAAGASLHVVGHGLQTESEGSSSIVVLRTPDVDGTVAHDEAFAMAESLARHVDASLARTAFATLVIIGGDTAAAVLGDAEMAVGGTLAPGIPWCRTLVGGVATGPLVVTKPGGFGDVQALVALLAPPVPAVPAAPAAVVQGRPVGPGAGRPPRPRTEPAGPGA